MKGTIHYCLEETIKSNYGISIWQDCLRELGEKASFSFGTTILEDVDEARTLRLFEATAKTLNKSLKELFDEFGVYWYGVYAPKMYPQFYAKVNSTRDFLKGLDYIHQIVTNKKPGARPPRFDYEWTKDGKLLMTYNSQRGLFELFESLLRGLDVYFQNQTKIDRVGENSLMLEFSH